MGQVIRGIPADSIYGMVTARTKCSGNEERTMRIRAEHLRDVSPRFESGTDVPWGNRRRFSRMFPAVKVFGISAIQNGAGNDLVLSGLECDRDSPPSRSAYSQATVPVIDRSG